MKITIKSTQNPTILKFQFPDFIVKKTYEFKNIDEAKKSPIAQKLFYFPFVKTVFLSGDAITIERYQIVSWEEVQEEVAALLEDYLETGQPFVIEEAPSLKKNPITIYAESTPNPAVVKFVANKKLTDKTVEFKTNSNSESAPLAKALFEFNYVKEIFIDQNYISITKNETADWFEVSNELRTFIKDFIENGGQVVNEDLVIARDEYKKQEITHFESLDATSQQIINIIEEYVKPAVAADGGNILFESYDATQKQVKVILQGACSGCPSSTFTLKNGIENMLKNMLQDDAIVVEAVNG